MKRVRLERSQNFDAGAAGPWRLKLYVARGSAASATALVQLNRIRAEYLPANSIIEVIDIHDDPVAAEQGQVLAIPTLVRERPGPVRRIIGDLSDLAVVLTSIGFFAAHAKISIDLD